MSPDTAQVLERALALSDDERVELIVRLLDTIGRGEPAPAHELGDDSAAIAAAWIAEARQRLRDIDAGRVEPLPWDEARARIFAHEP